MLPYNRNLTFFSRQLRKEMPEPERRLWYKLRLKQIEGFQFYRQKQIGKYIVDFYCPKARLVIEVDGDDHYHDEKMKQDRNRDEFLNNRELKVLRFTNLEVMKNIEGVVETIRLEVGGN